MGSKLRIITQRGGGLKCLQGLRGYGVLAIFVSHCPDLKIGSGGLGVQYFILMSGFLAAMKYYDSGVSGLFRKRLRTYYPMHIFTLICSLILGYKSSWNVKKVIKLGLNASLLQSYIPVSSVYFSFNAVSWYLSLTLFFAMITPAALRLLHKVKRENFVIIGLCLIQFLWLGLALMMPAKFQHWLVYVSPFVRSIDFFIGGLIFLSIRNSGIDERINYLFVPVVIYEIFFVVISRTMNTNFPREFFSVSAWTIPNIILLACILLNEGRDNFINKIFTNKFIVYIGNISFEFFILHTLVLRVTGWLFKKMFVESHTFSVYAAALILTIITAHISHQIQARLKGIRKFWSM